jgi:hypothetical protein
MAGESELSYRLERAGEAAGKKARTIVDGPRGSHREVLGSVQNLSHISINASSTELSRRR